MAQSSYHEELRRVAAEHIRDYELPVHKALELALETVSTPSKHQELDPASCSKAEFVRKFSDDVPAKSIVAACAAVGLTVSISEVRSARRARSNAEKRRVCAPSKRQPDMSFVIHQNDQERDLTVNVHVNPDRLKDEYGIDPHAAPWTTSTLLLSIPVLVLVVYPFFR